MQRDFIFALLNNERTKCISERKQIIMDYWKKSTQQIVTSFIVKAYRNKLPRFRKVKKIFGLRKNET